MVTGRSKKNWPLIVVGSGFAAAVAVILGYLFLSTFADPSEKFRVENFTFTRLSQTNDVVYAGVSPDGSSVAYNTIEPNGDRFV